MNRLFARHISMVTNVNASANQKMYAEIKHELQTKLRRVKEDGATHRRASTHHVYRRAGQISLSDQPVLVGDVQAFLGQGLDDRVVSQQRFDSIAAEDQASRPAVELRGLEQAGHRGLQVLLVVLVPV